MNSVSLSTPTTMGGAENDLQRAFGGGAPGDRGAEPAGDLFHLVGLDVIAYLQVLVIVEADAALIPGQDLARIVLEAPQADHLPGVDDHVVAHQAGRGIAGNAAVDDEAAGNRADARNTERIAHLGSAEHL